MPQQLSFSIIIPVYNRPGEVDELLESLSQQTHPEKFEVIVVDDGSSDGKKCDVVANRHSSQLDIKYFYKPNSGAGLSRNFGMTKATGTYFIILDSDVILPPQYLSVVHQTLDQQYTDIYGGPDTAHHTFTPLQKSINYAMTSFWTTGGLRGGKNNKDFQPRSFNLGMSREVFHATGGFKSRKIGEDIDFSFRTKQMGYTSQLIPEAYVYHKRRNTLKQFFKQTFAFGKERPKLNKEFPGTSKLTYWFPTLFALGLIFSIICFIITPYLPFIYLYGLYLSIVGVDSALKNKSIVVGLMSMITTITQFFGYGFGFLTGLFR
ncbi:MAG: glycosyl transferase family 2 [Flavobacteriia bacterium]|nr:MAG: glycosyl transferase family 2 [Flavobacteriia bacterium]